MSRSRRSAKARVSLRPLTEEDIAAVEPWYREAVAGQPAADAERWAIVREAGGTVIGRLDCRANSPRRGWLTFEWVEIEAGRRGWGYGSEAVRLLEAEAKAVRFQADVDAGNGLGLYFWLRLGYRPARPGEAPGWPQSGIITMVRAAGDGPG